VQGISTTADATRDQMAGSVFGKPAPQPTAKSVVPEITRFGK
jgi:hypothetical protein